MMLEVLLSQLEQKNVVIFGAGEFGKKVFALIAPYKIDFFVDNDQSKWNTTLFDIKILPPIELLRINKDDLFIFVSSMYEEEISFQLNEMNLEQNLHYCSAKLLLESGMDKETQAFEPGHFYSPIPSIKEIKEYENWIFGSFLRDLGGIDLNVSRQIQLMNEIMDYSVEFPYLNREHREEMRYTVNNDFFGVNDAYALYGLIRHLSPRRIIEVGSGYSSAVMLDTREYFMGQVPELTFVEPYPERLYSVMKDEKEAQVIIKKIQEVDIGIFDTLERNDILFIDSSHVSKVASDVNKLVFEVLPRLQAGVYVHFHDIFYPFEYPKEWIYGGRAWNEAYLLRAFLQYNKTFSIQLWNPYLETYHSEEVYSGALGVCLANRGGSLWLRKEEDR